MSQTKKRCSMDNNFNEAVYSDDRYTSIHAAVLFADLENSVMISSVLPGPEYNQLINTFQGAMLEVVHSLQAQTKTEAYVAEYHIAGDQLSIFFYDPTEVERNYLLDGPDPLTGDARAAAIAASRKINTDIAISALKAAIQLKNRWLIEASNMARVVRHYEPFGVAIGLHAGRVHYSLRSDGTKRAEGYTINLAKRIEGFARQGVYSRIMVSQKYHDLIRTCVIKHTQLRSRIFFHQHDMAMELLKGISHGQAVYELKFYHRLGVQVPLEVVTLYEAIFASDKANAWAFYQLVVHYVYQVKEWPRVLELANIASVVHPRDEMVHYVLSKYYFAAGNMEMSQRYAENALRLNDGFDLAHEQLAWIAQQTEDLDAQIYHWREAATLSPGSAVNHLNLGLVLLETGKAEKGDYHVREALRIYPEYKTYPLFSSSLSAMKSAGKLPESMCDLLQDTQAEAAAG